MIPKGKPNPELYEVRKESLELFKDLSREGQIDLYYGDETKISEEGYCPYGWQFDDEEVVIPASRGASINCFGIISRENDFFYRNTRENIDAQFIIETIDSFSLRIKNQQS